MAAAVICEVDATLNTTLYAVYGPECIHVTGNLK
jgi:hypothetical protein